MSTDLKALAEDILAPLDRWSCQCHAASIALVKHPDFPKARVARGFCQLVGGGQHSWVVVGHDCYHPDAVIVDPTVWSYEDSVKGVWVGSTQDRLHSPKGAGNIWEYGKPQTTLGEPVKLKGDLSSSANSFIQMLGPMDQRGWIELAHFPVEGWPADEIIAAIDDQFPGMVPIDIIGMVTDRNPGGLYLRESV